jgi:four helix bundle protein
MRNFRSLEVWVESMELARTVYKITQSLPEEEKFGLVAQMRRAVISISANIAEGSSRRTAVDFARFLEIALGSSFELETYLELVRSFDQNKSNEVSLVMDKLHLIQKRVNALRESILKPK